MPSLPGIASHSPHFRITRVISNYSVNLDATKRCDMVSDSSITIQEVISAYLDQSDKLMTRTCSWPSIHPSQGSNLLLLARIPANSRVAPDWHCVYIADPVSGLSDGGPNTQEERSSPTGFNKV